MKPDAAKHNPDPSYLQSLLDQTGLTLPRAARQIGISDRMLRYYLTPLDAGRKRQTAPYPVQFALECLACSSKCA